MDGGTSEADTTLLVLHELRAPLGLMATAARAAFEGESSEVRQHCAVIERTAQRMLRVAMTVLDMARALRAEQMSWFSPGETLRALVDDLHATGVDISMDSERTASYTYGHEHQWEALAHSLLMNAADHARPGTALKVEMDDVAGCSVLRIRNVPGSGSGHRGLGLGLPLCERLADELGARLEFEASEDLFTAVVRLPITAPTPETFAAAEPREWVAAGALAP